MKSLCVATVLFFLPGVGACSPPTATTWGPSGPPDAPSPSAVAVSSDHPHEEMSPERVEAWINSGVAGIPSLVSALGRADWEAFSADDCGMESTGSLLQITRDMTRRSAACARAFSEVLKATTTVSEERFGILLGLSNVDRIPPVLYDGLLASLSDKNPGNRMRASEILARSGFRQAIPAIKAAMQREPVASTRNRMSYHLYQLGDPAGDPKALRR